MKIIYPCVEYIPQTDNTLNGIYKQIEKAGRTCYKSEDKITEDSAEAFVHRMIESNHTAMLEHGTVYLKMPKSDVLYRKFSSNPYTIITCNNDYRYITTNYRVIIENNLNYIFEQYAQNPEDMHIPRITLKFTTNIGVTREGNRMRANSIAEESTRYCNYTKNRFGNEINICLPSWISEYAIEIQACRDDETEARLYADMLTNNLDNNWNTIDWYLYGISSAAYAYKQLIKLGWKPQKAREVLPLATKSDVVYTAFPHQWKHFFDLRLFGTTGIPHPNMKEIAFMARNVLIKNNLWNLVYPDGEPVLKPFK